MMASVQKMMGVRRDEFLPASLLFLYLFLVIGAYIIGQSVGDALFLSVYPKRLPHAIVATAVVAGIVFSVYIRLSHRLRMEPLIAGTLLFLAGAFALLWWLSQAHRRLAYVLDDDIGLAQKLEFARQLCRIPEGSNSQAVRTPIHSGDRWLAACAIYTVGELGLDELREETRNLEVGNDSLLQETRQRVLNCPGAGVAEGDGMLTVLGKVDILQKAPVFADVPTESLARVAAICAEASYAAGEALYRENEAADRIFVLLEGEVAIARHGVPGRNRAVRREAIVAAGEETGVSRRRAEMSGD